MTNKMQQKRKHTKTQNLKVVKHCTHLKHVKKAHDPNTGRVHTSEGQLPVVGQLSAGSAHIEPKV